MSVCCTCEGNFIHLPFIKSHSWVLQVCLTGTAHPHGYFGCACRLLHGNWYGPASLQSDWLIAGAYNTIRTFFSTFAESRPFLSFCCSCIWNSRNLIKFLSCLIFGHFNTGQTLEKWWCHYNKQFTKRVTRSALEIRSPHFYARPSQARTVQKRSGFVLPSTDRVTRAG